MLICVRHLYAAGMYFSPGISTRIMGTKATSVRLIRLASQNGSER